MAQEQSQLLQTLAKDIHDTGRFLHYKAYDLEQASLALRKSANNLFPGNISEKSSVVDSQNVEEASAKQMVENSAKMLELATAIRDTFEKLVVVLAENPDFGGLEGEEDDQRTPIAIASQANPGPDLEAQFANELIQARRVFVDSTKFIPTNFDPAATPVHQAIRYDPDTYVDIDPDSRIDPDTMANIQIATMELQSILNRSADDDDNNDEEQDKGKQQESLLPPAEVVGRVSRIDLRKERELLPWIPTNIGAASRAGRPHSRTMLVQERPRCENEF